MCVSNNYCTQYVIYVTYMCVYITYSYIYKCNLNRYNVTCMYMFSGMRTPDGFLY